MNIMKMTMTMTMRGKVILCTWHLPPQQCEINTEMSGLQTKKTRRKSLALILAFIPNEFGDATPEEKMPHPEANLPDPLSLGFFSSKSGEGVALPRKKMI